MNNFDDYVISRKKNNFMGFSTAFITSVLCIKHAQVRQKSSSLSGLHLNKFCKYTEIISQKM